MILELGAGRNPNPFATVLHDRTKHSDYIDVAWDLHDRPWPWKDGEVEQIIATDVFEHLSASRVHRFIPGTHGGPYVAPERDWWWWLDECWRILEPEGLLNMRLPAWDNPLTYRDPTHRTSDGGVRSFHEETFAYWDPCTQVWRDYGSIYDLVTKDRYWHVRFVRREEVDFRYYLTKVGAEHVPVG